MTCNQEYYQIYSIKISDIVNKKERSSLDEIATISDSDVFLVVYDAHEQCVNIF